MRLFSKFLMALSVGLMTSCSQKNKVEEALDFGEEVVKKIENAQTREEIDVLIKGDFEKFTNAFDAAIDAEKKAGKSKEELYALYGERGENLKVRLTKALKTFDEEEILEN